jgi:hypothetical protein
MRINGVYVGYREELNIKIYGLRADYDKVFYIVLNRTV